MNELSLIRLIQSEADTSAFEILVRQSQSSLRGYLRLLCKGQEELADEIAQETYLKVWNSIESFEGKSRFSTWLIQIARNTFFDFQKKRRIEISGELEDSSAVVSSDTSDRMDLVRALECLPIEEREVLILSYVEGLSHSEISDLTLVPVGTVKSRILQAKNKMNQFYEGVRA